MKLLKLNMHDVVTFCCYKQHIIPGSQANSIQEVASSLVGIHAARLVTPYFALRARLLSLEHKEIQEALYSEKSLIKARCMRGTLHLLPPALFPIAHHATLTKRLSICNALYKKLNIKKKVISEIAEMILEVLGDGPLTVSSIEKKVVALASIQKKETATFWAHTWIRAVLKELWESGELCYINASTTFCSEMRLYGLLSRTYPMFNLTQNSDEEEAIINLVERHTQGYGPVTISDIAWWSGIAKVNIKAALEKLSGRVISVEIEGFQEKFWMMNSDLDAMERFQFPNYDWVAVLAHEDPSLKGYYSSRGRYVSPEHYNLLFNDIGESRPAIMLNGRVVGIWTLNKMNGRISKKLFQPLNTKRKELIEKEIDKVRHNLPFLGQSRDSDSKIFYSC